MDARRPSSVESSGFWTASVIAWRLCAGSVYLGVGRQIALAMMHLDTFACDLDGERVVGTVHLLVGRIESERIDDVVVLHHGFHRAHQIVGGVDRAPAGARGKQIHARDIGSIEPDRIGPRHLGEHVLRRDGVLRSLTGWFHTPPGLADQSRIRPHWRYSAPVQRARFPSRTRRNDGNSPPGCRWETRRTPTPASCGRASRGGAARYLRAPRRSAARDSSSRRPPFPRPHSRPVPPRAPCSQRRPRQWGRPHSRSRPRPPSGPTDRRRPATPTAGLRRATRPAAGVGDRR